MATPRPDPGPNPGGHASGTARGRLAKLEFDRAGYIDEYVNDLVRIIDEIRPELQAHATTIATILDSARTTGHRVFTMGNGGSGAAASHLAADLMKYTITDGEPRYKAICLSDNQPNLLAIANDQSYADVFVEPLINHAEPGDVLIGISGSGNSENCVHALKWARDHGVTTITWTGYGGGLMAEASDHALVIPSHSMVRCEDIHVIIHHSIASMLKHELDASRGTTHIPAHETRDRIG